MDRFRWIGTLVSSLVVMAILAAILISSRPRVPAVVLDADGIRKDDENHLWYLIGHRHMTHEAAVAQIKADRSMLEQAEANISDEDKRRFAYEREKREKEIESVAAASCQLAPWQNKCQ